MCKYVLKRFFIPPSKTLLFFVMMGVCPEASVEVLNINASTLQDC